MRNLDRADRVRAFYRGRLYPVLVAVLILCGNVSGLDVPFAAAAILLVLPGFFIARDLEFTLPQFMMITLTITGRYYDPATSDYGYSRFGETRWLVIEVVGIVSILAGLAYFIWRNWKIRNRMAEKTLPVSVAILCAAMFCNGAFHTPYYAMNFWYVGTFFLATAFLGFLFVEFRRLDPGSTDRFLYCVMVTGLLVLAELIAAYFTTVQFVDGKVVKETVVVGWGVWTNVGGMLAFLMPACFRFAYDRRHGWIYFLLGLAMFAGTLMSQSRGALLVGGVILLICLAMLCTGGPNRRQNRILTAGVLAVGIVGAIVLVARSSGLIRNFLETGMNDNGRFDLWKAGLEHFRQAPIFGSGFYDSFVNEWNVVVYPYLYHNTLVQMLGACGLVGFAAYLWHRIVTVRLAWKHRHSVQTRFLAVCVLGLLLFSLIDVLLFKTYPTIIYTLMIVWIGTADVTEW